MPAVPGRSLGLVRIPGYFGGRKGPDGEKSTSSSEGDPSDDARSGHFVHHRRRSFNLCWFSECSPAQIVDDLAREVVVGHVCRRGERLLRASTSAEAGLPPSVQAARTRKAVSTNSLGLIDPVSWLFQYFRPECMFLYMGRQFWASHSPGTVSYTRHG
jgi:hypothetical protein